MANFTMEQIKQIKKLANHGWSYEYISWEYKTTIPRVRDIVRKPLKQLEDEINKQNT